ncbi:hypothetical protein [Anatilimnocola aggregata]|nr:hypothetical protein [Anatilimnocola aggregata]
MPSIVRENLESALTTGIVTPAEAAPINNWLNERVRVQPRRLERIVVDYEVMPPTGLLETIRDGGTLSAEDRGRVLRWLTITQRGESGEIHESVLKAVIGEPIDPAERTAIGRWIMYGPGMRSRYNLEPWRERGAFPAPAPAYSPYPGGGGPAPAAAPEAAPAAPA